MISRLFLMRRGINSDEEFLERDDRDRGCEGESRKICFFWGLELDFSSSKLICLLSWLELRDKASDGRCFGGEEFWLLKCEGNEEKRGFTDSRSSLG